MAQTGKWTWDDNQQKLIPYEESKQEVNAPWVITDDMNPLHHPINNKVYTSKKRFREVTKMFGYEEVDKGYRAKKEPDPNYEKNLEKDLTEAYYQCRDGMAPLSELDREKIKIIDHNLKEYNHDQRPRRPDGSVIE